MSHRQAWLTQDFPPVHFAQTPPLAPQASLDVPAWQVTPSGPQQPAQVAGSHRQAPFTHFWPREQALPPAPQEQVPLLRQRSKRYGSHVLQIPPLPPQVAIVFG